MHGPGSRKIGTIWFAALLLVAFTAGDGKPAAAQEDQGITAPPNQTPGPGQVRRVVRGVKLRKTGEKLSLTAEQQKGMRLLVENKLARLRVLREDRSLTKDQKLEKFRQIRAETHDKINELLTPEQQKIYAETSANERKLRESRPQ